MMRRIPSVLGALLLILAGRAGEVQGRIGGVVRSVTTGEPVKSAVVTLRSPDAHAGPTRTATTGPAGTFLFESLPAGSYQLSIRKAGYRTLYSSAGGITLRENQQLTGLAYSLWPNAAVSGRVLDADGEPVQGARIRAYALQHRRSGPGLSFAGEDRSNDLGEYRIYDLPAGKFLLQVRPPPPTSLAGRFYASVAASFYPGAATPSQAVPLSLSWGQDLQGVDMKFAAFPTYAVTGLVWDTTLDAPCSRCVVRAVQIDGPWVIASPDTVKVSSKGVFVIRGLTPGDYTLVAARGGAGDLVGQRTVSLRNRNHEGVVLAVGLRQPVSGEIVLENPVEGIDVTEWKLRLVPLALPESWPEGEGYVESSLRFHTEEVPPAVYRLEVLNLPAGAYFKALRSGGRDLARPELSVPEDAAITGLQVIIAFDGATVSGRVWSGSSGKEPVAARVFLVPDQNSSPYADAVAIDAAADGSFRIHSIVPGAYTLYALPAMSTAQVFDPGVQAVLRRFARTVNLRPGEHETLDLPLGGE